jgi:RNase H-like domain found in reverse transcriptase/Integrase zinc binding domain/Integrase core domain
MVNYYFKFIKSSTEVLFPLYQLHKKDNEFIWNKKCDNAFKEIKNILTSAPILIHFNQNYKIKLACDASSYGIGGVISHILPNNEERPIAYTSRTLNLAEQKYSQIDKEALAIVFCIKKFHQYLYGRHFILITDHKPLTYIFHEKKSLPQVAANRIQRYALFLADYDYSIEYVKSENNQSADALSRLAISHKNDIEMDIPTIHFVNDYFQGINKVMIQKETEQDKILSLIKKYILIGWPNTKLRIIPEPIKPYYLQKNELSVEQNCIFLGHRLVVPKSLQEIFLNELHSTHFGIVKLKMAVRNYFWWPQLNKHIEQLVASCSTCIKYRKEPTKSPLHVWEYPKEPGERIHADFLELNKKMFIVIIDEFSKWPEVIQMTSTTSLNTINVMREYFARYGICKTFVTDNGPQWISREFKIFIKNNCIKHILTPPYHPQSKGAAENMVGIFKDKMKKILNNTSNIIQASCKFLLDYRNTIHCTTGKSPAELHMNRKLNNTFDLVLKQFKKETDNNDNINVKTKVELSQKIKKETCRSKRKTNFKIGDCVLARNYSKGQKWIRGTIKEKLGKVIFLVDTECGQIKRHIDQLLQHKVKERNMREEKVNVEEMKEVRKSKRLIRKPKKFDD